MGRTGRVQAIDRAVMVLDCFTEQKPELKLSEITEMLDINKSTLHGIIATLKYHGLMAQDENTQQYRLGLKHIEYGQRVQNSIDISSIARPIIQRVCDELEETVHIGTLDRDEVVYIEKNESQQSMRIFTTIGSRKPAHATGVGKAMLAYLDQEDLNKVIKDEMIGFTPNTIINKELLKIELAGIRDRGFAYDNEENILGLSCVAAPIFDYTGNVKYGISVSGPTMRMSDEKMEKAISAITEAALEISRRLGYRG